MKPGGQQRFHAQVKQRIGAAGDAEHLGGAARAAVHRRLGMGAEIGRGQQQHPPDTARLGQRQGGHGDARAQGMGDQIHPAVRIQAADRGNKRGQGFGGTGRAGLCLPDRAARRPAKGQGQTVLRAGQPQMARPADGAGHVAARGQRQDMSVRAVNPRPRSIAKAVDQHGNRRARGKGRQAALQRCPVEPRGCAFADDGQKGHGMDPYLGDTGAVYTSRATGG